MATAFVATLVLWSGSRTDIYPPADPAHPTTVLVTDYGRHSSLILPDGPAHCIEYTFGDWYYFALDHESLPIGIWALLDSSGGTLGRRRIACALDDPRVRSMLGAIRVQPIQVSADAVAGLRQKLDAQYARHLDTEVYNPDEHMHFVKSDLPYGLWHNCNQLTAEWLRVLDCKTRGWAVYSHFDVVKPAN
jgi:hypothetical protein